MRAQLIAFFNSNKVQNGFSEVYHLEAATYLEATTAAFNMLTHRLALMCSDVELAFARVSSIDVRGDSKIIEEFTYPAPGTYSTTKLSEPLSNALLLRQEATELRRGMRELRAVPDEVFDGQKYTTIMGWEAALAVWANDLLGDPWRLRVKGPILGVSPALTGITAVKNTKRVTHRNVGRPFGFARGRQPA